MEGEAQPVPGDALEAGERFGGHAREDLHEEVVREPRGRMVLVELA